MVKIEKSNCLATTHPEIAAQWHPTLNGDLTPYDVTHGSSEKVVWKCPKAEDHEWTAKVIQRTFRKGTKCPCCRNLKTVTSNSLATTRPEIAAEWHPTLNGKLTPHDFTPGSNKPFWWKCAKGDDHEWEASIVQRTKKNGTNCAVCSNRRIVKSNCLATLRPDLAKEWHPTNNGILTPYDVGVGGDTEISWKCPKAEDHIWIAKIYDRAKKNGTGCPYCSNQKTVKSNCLATTHPHIAQEWHPKKNGDFMPYMVGAGSPKKVWWKCPRGDDHEWEASIENRTKKNGTNCSVCANLKTVLSNCLATTHPDLAKEWHPTKNGNLTPFDVVAGSSEKVYWKCPNGDDHEWPANISSRAGKNASGCSVCDNKTIVLSNCLVTTHAHLVKEWHPTKNGPLTPMDVGSGSHEKAWWQCLVNPDHIWNSMINTRTSKNPSNCPYCNQGWTIDNIRLFVKSLLPHLSSLSTAELYVLFQQNGILNSNSKGKAFIQGLKTGKFPIEELEKFVNGDESLVDTFINDSQASLEQLYENIASDLTIDDSEFSDLEDALPLIETKDILSTINSSLLSNVDAEAIEFFVASAVAKIWNHVFLDEDTAISQLTSNEDGLYAKSVKDTFIEQYYGAKQLKIPNGYSFKKEGKVLQPNLMQRFTAYMIQSKKRLGNWSGTGAGKTLSAILSSRLIDAKLTIICCPNNVIDGWVKNIELIYPNSVIFVKDLAIELDRHKNNYLILNYEFFQKPNTEGQLKDFISEHQVDFVVIDEIHYSKQRVFENMSKRKKVIASMLSEIGRANEDLHVLGMSATPVINNLYEGKTLVELVTGVLHDDMNTTATVSNCIALYQKLVSNGIRWMPRYSQSINIQTIEVDCEDHVDQIKCIPQKGGMVELEGVLTLAKIPEIIKHIKRKTIVYTHYLQDIIIPLKEGIEAAGWNVGIYSGDDKTGLKDFIEGDADVLVATSCVATGVDGLQDVCNRIIINVLPWTHSEFEQLKGRIFRQGQKQSHVDIIIPLTFANVNGERWSWCESKWKRIQFKKSIADAAVDGIIPEGHLRTPAQAYQDAMGWLKRLDEGKVLEVEKHKINLSLSEGQFKTNHRKYGDFSKMNRQLNTSRSDLTHKRFNEDPSEWEYYHAMYREARKDWPVVPYKEAIKWIKARPYAVIGDFGCGEAFIKKEVDNVVYSFDHIAIDENVLACDMSNVPLEDCCLDAAIFSLALMGSNHLDYIREAHRCLKLDGHLWIAETTSRYETIGGLQDELFKLGFDITRIQEKSIFTFIRAIKTERVPSDD